MLFELKNFFRATQIQNKTSGIQIWENSTIKGFAFFSFIVLLHISNISTKVATVRKGHVSDISLNNIAIIGKGLGAALCSYYLHQMIPNVQIDIYDHKSDYKYPLRTVAHNRNLYMNEIIKEKEIMVYTYANDYCRRSLVKDDNKINFFGAKDLAETDPNGYSQLQEFIKKQIEKFEKIYEFQKVSKSFKTVRELLNQLDPDFLIYYTQETISSLLNKIMNPEASPDIIKFVKSRLLWNCLADINTNAFAGLETLMFSEITGNVEQIVSVEEDFLKKLFHKEDNFLKNDNFLKKDISKIIYSKEDNVNYIVSTDNRPIKYDFIILDTVTADKIKFEGFKEQVSVFKYAKVNVAYVSGDLVEIYKNLPSNESLVIDLDKNQTFSFLEGSKYGISKGSVEPSESEILEYVNPCIVHRYGAFTSYPDYSTNKKSVLNSKFELGENLYNVLALDPLSMATNEMLAISAKNIAFLIREKVLKNTSSLKTDGDSTSHAPPSRSNLSKNSTKSRRMSKKKKPTQKL